MAIRHGERLSVVKDRLVSLFEEADRVLPYDILIVTGFRGKEKQNERYQEGASDKPWPESKHNKRPALAVDSVPYLRNRGPVWTDKPFLTLYLGKLWGLAAARGMNLRLGIDWDQDGIPVQSDETEDFFDGAHVEIDDKTEEQDAN